MSNHRYVIKGRRTQRGYLPHLEGGQVPQFVTFRLADALPSHVVEQLKAEVARLPKSIQRAELSRRIDAYLDEGWGSCVFEEAEAARCVERAIRHFDGDRYRLHAWVVMPNHVHTAFTPLDGYEWSSTVGSWKRFTAVRINRALGRTGRLWQPSAFDRAIRDDKHFKEVVWYIHNNPVSAGLCDVAEDWRWSSAAERGSFKECR